MNPDSQFGDFGPNRGARDAQHAGSFGLVATRLFEYLGDETSFDLVDNGLVKRIGVGGPKALNQLIERLRKFQFIFTFRSTSSWRE